MAAADLAEMAAADAPAAAVVVMMPRAPMAMPVAAMTAAIMTLRDLDAFRVDGFLGTGFQIVQKPAFLRRGIGQRVGGEGIGLPRQRHGECRSTGKAGKSCKKLSSFHKSFLAFRLAPNAPNDPYQSGLFLNPR